jgi:hypothetical protein
MNRNENMSVVPFYLILGHDSPFCHMLSDLPLNLVFDALR